MHVRLSNGADGMLVIEAPTGAGKVHASLGTTAIVLDPKDVSRLVDLYRLAQSVALQDRGTW